MRLQTRPSLRKDFRSRMAGGELRFGTMSIYMATYYSMQTVPDALFYCFIHIHLNTYMATQKHPFPIGLGNKLNHINDLKGGKRKVAENIAGTSV